MEQMSILKLKILAVLNFHTFSTNDSIHFSKQLNSLIYKNKQIIGTLCCRTCVFPKMLTNCFEIQT